MNHENKASPIESFKTDHESAHRRGRSHLGATGCRCPFSCSRYPYAVPENQENRVFRAGGNCR